MKNVLWTVLGLVGLFMVVAVVTATPLVGEVVTLHTRAAGEWQTTPLWIVEDEGQEYLRAGNPGSSWVDRMRSDPAVRLERAGELADVELVAEPTKRARVNELMNERYGWADDFIGLMGERGSSLPLRVERSP